MRMVVVLALAVVFAVVFVPPVQGADPDAGGKLADAARVGVEIEGAAVEGPGIATHLEPRNINLSAEDWDNVGDSALLRVRGRDANSAGGTNSQAFGVVACDRAGADDTAAISLMRVAVPREVVTSANNSTGGFPTGATARTAPRFRPEGSNETLFAVISTPQLNGVADAGWQIASGGYRILSVSLLDTFNGGGAAPVVSFTIGCGVTIFPF